MVGDLGTGHRDPGSRLEMERMEQKFVLFNAEHLARKRQVLIL